LLKKYARTRAIDSNAEYVSRPHPENKKKKKKIGRASGLQPNLIDMWGRRHVQRGILSIFALRTIWAKHPATFL
jgi:hypothetical protein